MIWSISAKPSSRRKREGESVVGRALLKIEYAKSQMRTKVKHLFWVIKHQFG